MITLETFSTLLEAKSETEWCDALFSLSSRFGFEKTMFAIVPRSGMPLGKAFLRSTYAEPWRIAYDKAGMVHFDPTVIHCLTRTTPLVWSPEIFESEAQKRMYEEAAGFGLRTGMTLPMHGPSGEVGISCFVTDRPFTPALERELTHQMPGLALLRDVALETSRPYFEAQARESLPRLTKREHECLKWTAAGKTSWEIARILSCSEAVVNFHLLNVRRKMGLNSRRAAAVHAVRLGLISLD